MFFMRGIGKRACVPSPESVRYRLPGNNKGTVFNCTPSHEVCAQTHYCIRKWTEECGTEYIVLGKQSVLGAMFGDPSKSGITG